ncbi:Uncharacterised protein [Shewanella putrefaciens]|nr:Uncharacterised protein [Shewanella putrefaciens]
MSSVDLKYTENLAMGGLLNYLECAKHIGGVEPSLRFLKKLIYNGFWSKGTKYCYTLLYFFSKRKSRSVPTSSTV